MCIRDSFKVDGPAGPVDVNVSAGSANGTLVSFRGKGMPNAVSYTHLRAHETVLDLVCRLLLEKKKKMQHEPTRRAYKTTEMPSSESVLMECPSRHVRAR